MESGQLRKLNLCYAGIQSLYWAGFAAIWAFLSVLLLYRGFSNSQIGTVSALALLMPLAVQPVLASLADRDRRFTSRRLAMALTGLLLLCAVGLWCSAGSMVVTAALYVLVGISLTATAPFHSAMAMELQQHGVALNSGLSRGLGSACYAASVLVLGVVVERYAPTAVLPVFAGEMLLLLLLTWRFRASRTMEATAGSGPVLSVGQVLRRYPAYTWLLVGCALLMACHSATCTYMIHIVGKVGGSAVFVLDFGKGIVSGLIAAAAAAMFGGGMSLSGHVIGYDDFVTVAFLGCVWGHIFSPWLGFKGGKGIAVAVGCLFVTFGWQGACLELAIFAVLVLATKYVSVGSIAAAGACPLFAAYYFLYATFAPAAWVCTTVAALTVVWAHRGNIERLRAGNERRIGQKGKEA